MVRFFGSGLAPHECQIEHDHHAAIRLVAETPAADPRLAPRSTVYLCPNALGGVDKLAMLGEQVSLGLVDRAAIPIDFTL